MFERLKACFCLSEETPDSEKKSEGNLKRMSTIDFPVIVEPLKDEWLQLSQAPEDLGVFTYEGKLVKGRVVRVLDGDTVQVIILNEGKLESHRFRLFGIDAPEMHPKKDSSTRDDEKEAAVISKEKLEEKLAEDSNLCVVSFTKDDKYGRRMGSLSTRMGININDWMVAKGYAVPYGGGKKKPFEAVKQAIEEVVKKVFEPSEEKKAEVVEIEIQ
jgi:endonuclease YncB( thermonuclease family)